VEQPAETSLGHFPDGKWKFDASVTTVFEDMLRRSIPDYANMRRLVLEIGARHAKPETHLVDLGCSRGASINDFLMAVGNDLNYLGVDVSAPMVAAAKERFKHHIDAGIVSIEQVDLTQMYPVAPASVTLAVLTLQFIEPKERARIIQQAYQNTVPGGVFIVVEKVLGRNQSIDDELTEWYEDMKHSNGYTREEIASKKKSLVGVLVPRTAEENIISLELVGFKADCFWRCMNFAGFVGVKS